MEPILGVDVGGVIIDRVDDAADTSFFGDNYLQTTAVPGAFAALERLNAGRFAGRVYLVSKCGARVQAKTLAWLQHHGFYAATGIAPEHVHFCRKRADKADVCAALGITHFVDDRLEVLSYLETVPALYLFRPDADEVARYADFLPQVRQVASWDELLAELECAEVRRG
ncbi:MAG TPA: hypothetical protein VII06_22740 [Chloroflexota bacterium]|jgi:hypothetical protein